MQIENDILRVKFQTLGSEWTSLVDKRDDTQYAWSGDEKIWAGRNPTLFPFVGRVWQDTYRYADKSYHLGNHGLARRALFRPAAQTATTLTLRLDANQETLAVYPFVFTLENYYRLVGESLQITTHVINQDNKTLPFSLGAHPAFRCPLLSGEKNSDYRILLDQSESLHRLRMASDGSWARESEFFAQTSEIALDEHVFDDDVIALAKPATRSLTLAGPRRRVCVSCEQARYWGIWSKPGAPFVCLEPWLSHGDTRGFRGDLTTKPEITLLAPGEVFTFRYQITIGTGVTSFAQKV